MSKLYLDSHAPSKFVSLVATLTGAKVERIESADELAKVSATAHLPALVSGTEVHSGAVAAATAIAKAHNAALVGSGEEVAKFIEYALTDVEKAVTGDFKANLAHLHKLNKQILPVTFVAGNTLTVADIALLSVLGGRISAWSADDRFALVSVCRWYDNVQHVPSIAAHLPKEYHVEFVLDLPKAVEKKGGKKEADAEPKKDDSKKTDKPEAKKAGDAAPKQAKGEKDTSEKVSKQKAPAKKTEAAAAPSTEGGVDADFHRVEFRVGKIVECAKHPEADALYVEKIDLGEPNGPRTIVSGLVKFVPLDQMLNRLVVVVANLKPAKLRGVESCGMVLAASNADHTQVELVDPPAGAAVGERITFAGFPGEPDAQLNPKKKLFDDVKPHLHTNATLVAQYKDVPFMTTAGPCTVKSLADSSLG